MLTRCNTWIVALAVALMSISSAAFAQRPPSSQGPPELSIDRAWAWFVARPGVMIAVGVIVVAIVYMVATKRRSRT